MRLLRTCCSMLVAALVVAGCGLAADPVVSSEDEVLDALLALRDGAEGRLTAVLEVDRAEVRDVLRDDPEARALLAEELDGGDDVDDLLAAIDDARTRLADHALLLGTGADGSGRVAATTRGEVWLDLRAGGGATSGEDPAGALRVDLQARVDWALASEVLDEPDLLGDLDEAAARVAPFLGSLPETDAVQRVLLGLLGGELVAISGTLGPDLLDGLGAVAGAPDGTVGDPRLPTLGLDPREALATSLSFDDFRRDGADTLVDVSLELRAAAELALDGLAAAPEAAGLTAQDLAEARAQLTELPDRLTDVAVLRLGPDGDLRQVRADVLDLGLQLARSTDATDPDLAVVERVATQLDATGLFVVLDVTGVGTTPTVLGTPTASATPDEVAAAFGVLLLGGLAGGLDEEAVLDGLDGLTELDAGD